MDDWSAGKWNYRQVGGQTESRAVGRQIEVQTGRETDRKLGKRDRADEQKVGRANRQMEVQTGRRTDRRLGGRGQAGGQKVGRADKKSGG